MKKQEKPETMPMVHWILCNIFALNFAQQHGWFSAVKNYKDVSEDDYGYDTFQQGLNVAVVSYNFWTKNLILKPEDDGIRRSKKRLKIVDEDFIL